VDYIGIRSITPRYKSADLTSLGEKNDILNRFVASNSCTELRCALAGVLP